MSELNENSEKLESLLARVTDRRKELLTSVVDRRTRHFCMVLEDLFDPHNISAVIRTAEVFGLQDVHIIEEDNAYSVNKSRFNKPNVPYFYVNTVKKISHYIFFNFTSFF